MITLITIIAATLSVEALLLTAYWFQCASNNKRFNKVRIDARRRAHEYWSAEVKRVRQTKPVRSV